MTSANPLQMFHGLKRTQLIPNYYRRRVRRTRRAAAPDEVPLLPGPRRDPVPRSPFVFVAFLFAAIIFYLRHMVFQYPQ